jgi:hypothetical protein
LLQWECDTQVDEMCVVVVVAAVAAGRWPGLSRRAICPHHHPTWLQDPQDQHEPIFLDLTVCTLFASQVKSTDFQPGVVELADSRNPSTCNGASGTMAPQLPLKVLFVCYIAVAIASGVIAGAAKKPNIVWVLTDDQDQVRF